MAKCMFPYSVERKLYHSQEDKYVQVPCGKCPECLKRRVASWSFRLEIEALNWQRRYFVTLTYDTDHVPISPNTFMTLEPEHVTLFFKRLRKRSGKLKYYYCGEYGTRFKRPHYHLILFGNDSLLESDILKEWPYGDVFFGKVEPASIKYTVQYYDKGDWAPAHRRDDRVPEFSRMSHGLGKSFLSPEMVSYLLEDPSRSYLYNSDGHKIAIPRYYKNRLYDFNITETMVAHNPSLLAHRDEMLGMADLHHDAIAELMSTIPVLEETAQLNERRRAAIINYRKSKRKSRS